MSSEKRQSLIRTISKFIGAGFVMTLSNPFDLVRIRMQTMPELVQMGKINSLYGGIVDCAQRVTKQQGFRAFWKGNGANLIRFYASQSINFIAKQIIKKQMSKLIPNRNNTLLMNSLSGVIGSWLALSILYPIQYTRNHLSNNTTSRSQGIVRTMLNTAKNYGPGTLYTGCSISLYGVSIFRGTNFGIFDTYKQNKIGIQRWFLAYFSSLAAILLTYPSDTVRRRLICTRTSQVKYKGFFDCLKKIYQKEGIKKLYSGGNIIFLQSLGTSLILFLYDKMNADLKEFLN